MDGRCEVGVVRPRQLAFLVEHVEHAVALAFEEFCRREKEARRQDRQLTPHSIRDQIRDTHRCNLHCRRTRYVSDQVLRARTKLAPETTRNKKRVSKIGYFVGGSSSAAKASHLFENSNVEELLQLLVAVVDAELLEAVHREVL